jgi:hypothetical protein
LGFSDQNGPFWRTFSAQAMDFFIGRAHHLKTMDGLLAKPLGPKAVFYLAWNPHFGLSTTLRYAQGSGVCSTIVAIFLLAKAR